MFGVGRSAIVLQAVMMHRRRYRIGLELLICVGEMTVRLLRMNTLLVLLGHAVIITRGITARVLRWGTKLTL